jgi:TPR repeat protein
MFHQSCDTGTKIEGKFSCPSCNIIVPEEGSANEIEVLRGWVVKNKAWAQHVLGDRYQDGHGVEKSLNKAQNLYEASAEQNFGRSQAEMLRFSVMQQKYSQSIYWGEKLANNEEAATLHRGQACFNLGGMYSKGLGVKVSRDTARMWLKQAVKYGDEQIIKLSLDLLGRMGATDKIAEMESRKCASCNAAEQLPKKLLKCSNCKIT